MTETPAQKWNQTVSGYRRKCQKILDVSKSIRYTGIINIYGRTLTGIIRNGTKPLLKRNQAGNEFFIASTLLSMRKPQQSSIGSLEVAIFRHKKMILLLFDRNGITFYISIDKNVGIDKLEQIISKIKKVI